MNREHIFVETIQEHEGIIYKIARLYTENKVDQEDLYQEIVFQLWKAFESYRGDSKFSTWMYRVALNTALLQLKKKKKQGQKVSTDQIQLANEAYDPLMDERIAKMYEQIRQLNEVDKAIVFLFLEAKPYAEIGQILGLTENNVGTRMSRIKSLLKNRINT